VLISAGISLLLLLLLLLIVAMSFYYYFGLFHCKRRVHSVAVFCGWRFIFWTDDRFSVVPTRCIRRLASPEREREKIPQSCKYFLARWPGGGSDACGGEDLREVTRYWQLALQLMAIMLLLSLLMLSYALVVLNFIPIPVNRVHGKNIECATAACSFSLSFQLVGKTRTL